MRVIQLLGWTNIGGVKIIEKLLLGLEFHLQKGLADMVALSDKDDKPRVLLQKLCETLNKALRSLIIGS